MICPAGKFKAASGPAACSDCPSGTYSSSSGAVSAGTCVACPTHSASPPGSDASGDCTCNAGYTGPNGGTCTACEEGKYKDSSGTGACTACPANSESPAGASTCGAVTVVAYRGYEYRVLDGTAPTETLSGCQDYYLALPAGGWNLTADNTDTVA